MDLNMMMRDQARTSLQSQMDSAVAEGDAVKVRKIADDIAKLDVATAPPKAAGPAFGDKEIRAELGKLDWFGVDPVKSSRALELGKHMDPNKFASAALFTEALVKAVEGKTAAPAAGAGGDDEEGEGEDEGEGDADNEPAARRVARKTDAPTGDNDRTAPPTGRRAGSGPWVKMADAPAEIQKEIRRTADKFLPANHTKEQRATYEKNALASHYNIHQRSKGKK